MRNVKDTLVDCARDQLTTGGLRDFSLRKVASCAGVTPTAVYRHFVDREDLLQEVLLTGFRLFLSYLKDAVEESRIPKERLSLATEGYLQFALEQRSYYEVMFMSTDFMTGLTRIREEGARETREAFHFLTELVEACERDSPVRRADDGWEMQVEETDEETTHDGTVSIWAQCHGLVSLYFTGKITRDGEEFAAIYTRSVERIIKTL